jgi:hypothetical protein
VSEAVQDHVAEHRTFVIDQRQHYRFLAKVLAQANGLAGFVLEGEFERELGVEILVDADAASDGWEAVLLSGNRNG